MKVFSFNLHYNVVEFNYFITLIDDDCVNVLELLIDCNVDDFNEEDFNGVFIFETEKLTYVFSGFEVSEFYEENGYLHVVCVK